MKNYYYERKYLFNYLINRVEELENVFKFRNYSKYFKFGNYRKICKANVLMFLNISKKYLNFKKIFKNVENEP